MSLGGLAEHFTGLRIEGRVQGQGAMPVIFKAVPFGASRRQRQHRIFAIKRLNGRFLIDAKHSGVRNRDIRLPQILLSA
jgi:hypothetical protein